jgi:hypothetical protein
MIMSPACLDKAQQFTSHEHDIDQRQHIQTNWSQPSIHSDHSTRLSFLF